MFNSSSSSLPVAVKMESDSEIVLGQYSTFHDVHKRIVSLTTLVPGRTVISAIDKLPKFAKHNTHAPKIDRK